MEAGFGGSRKGSGHLPSHHLFVATHRSKSLKGLSTSSSCLAGCGGGASMLPAEHTDEGKEGGRTTEKMRIGFRRA